MNKGNIIRHLPFFMVWAPKVQTWLSRTKKKSKGYGRIRLTAYGKGNSIEIGENTGYQLLEIEFRGNNNKLIIGKDCYFERGCRMVFTANNGLIHIGNKTTMGLNSAVICHEKGNSIKIGDDVMMSINVIIRNSDGHPIYDQNGERTNPGKDVVIGNHVWIAEGARIKKGVTVGDGAVIGGGASVIKDVNAHSIVAGAPAKEIRSDIRWERKLTE